MHSLLHLLGGLVLLAIAVGAGGSVFGREAARAWDHHWPGTRPSRRQALAWARHPRTMARTSRPAPEAEPGGRRTIHEDCEVVPGRRPPRPAAAAVRPAPAPAGVLDRGGQPTHVISYLPPYLLGRKSHRDFPGGMWDLQDISAYDAGKPHEGGDRTLVGPRGTGPAALAEWASGVLGYPVRLERGTTQVRPGRLPLRRWRDEPVWLLRPAPAPPAPPRPAAPDHAPLTGRIVPPVTTPAVPAEGSRAVIAPGTEEMTTGMARFLAWVVAGNAEDKELGFADLAGAYQQHSDLVTAIGSSMEQDSRYPASVIEEVNRMALVLRALSMQAGEVEGRITALLNSTGRDMIRAGNVAPERRELLAEPGGA